MKDIDWLNILERAMWTFFEGFLVALPATFSVEMDGAAWKAAFLGAAMAGISALKTFILEVVKAQREKEDYIAKHDHPPDESTDKAVAGNDQAIDFIENGFRRSGDD